MRLSLVSMAVSFALAGLTTADPAHASIKKHTDIHAQDLSSALQQLIRERDLQVVYFSEDLKGVYTHGSAGELTDTEALAKLLRGTGLVYRYLDSQTVTIVPAQGGSGSIDSKESAQAKAQSDTASARESNSMWSRFRLAEAEETSSAVATSSGVGNSNSDIATGDRASVEEVVVTAQKREQKVQDVPMSMSVINTQDLSVNNQLRLQDYATSIPGFTVTPTPSAGSQNTLTIRGLTTGFNTGSTVSIVIDDVPFDGYTTPDLDPSDLDRIEVLRGPQGTLYGGGGMGGLVKYVTTDPSSDALSGRVQAGLSSVENGDQAGYNIRGAINVPVTDTLAFRASAFTRQDPGFIDNVTNHENGVNEERVVGTRVAALWRPTDDFSIRLSALYQDTEGFGFDGIMIGPGIGDLQQAYLPQTGAYDRQIQTYSATVKWNLGPVNVTSLTGYNVNRQHDSFDDSFQLGGLASQLLQNPQATAAPVRDRFVTYKFSEEMRLNGSIAALDWLTGLYYTRDLTGGSQDVYGAFPNTGNLAGSILHDQGPVTLEEGAVFADLTYHLTSRFDVQIGARESSIWQHNYPKTETGILLPGGGGVQPGFAGQTEHAFTYLFTPSFKLTPDLNVYGRLATGFRPGSPGYNGPDAVCTLDHFPCSTQPDKTTDYEVGTKGDALDHLIDFDLALYYIKWSDLVANFQDPVTTFDYSANVGTAKSEGVELSLTVHPTEGLTLSGWTTWNEAVLTSVPPGNGSEVPGARLPYGARWSGNFAINQKFRVSGRMTAFVGAQTTYIGQRYGTFAGPPRTVFSPYAQTDLRGGLSYGPWTGSLYINNVTDKRALIGGGLGTFPSNAFTIIRPRTVGVSVERTF